jgi:hypothetical protein
MGKHHPFSNETKQTASGCLHSLVHQLVRQSDDVPASLKELYSNGRISTPSLLQLTPVFVDLIVPGSFIVTDALDKCRKNTGFRERTSIFNALEAIMSSTTDKPAISIASRAEVDIKLHLKEMGAIDFNIQSQVVGDDIPSHVQTCIKNFIEFKPSPLDMKKQTEEKLTKGAGGM